MRHLLRAVLGAAAIVVLALPAPAAEQDGGLWATASLRAPIGERIAANVLVQPRVIDDIGTLERVLVRPSLSLRLVRSLSASLGYDAHLIETPRDFTEHRLWEQLALRTPLGELGIQHRLRLEQRFRDDWNETAWRLRYRLRASHPIGGGFAAVVSNELFFDLNGVRRGPRTGLGEDRFFAGLRRPLGRHLSAEGGYQLQYFDRPGGDAVFHLLMLGLSIDLGG